MIQIGITGGIGSGKSTVAAVFKNLGIPVYDADSHAKALMTTDGNLKERIKKEFGTLSFTDQGQLNREFLAAQVFSNPEKLKKLNQLVHPVVAADYQKWFVEQHNEQAVYVIKEAALLYESGSSQMLDKIIVVIAPTELRKKRVMERDNRPADQIDEIMAKQLSPEEMATKADFLILNDDKNLIVPEILKIHQQIVLGN